MSQARLWIICLLAFAIGASAHWQLNAQPSNTVNSVRPSVTKVAPTFAAASDPLASISNTQPTLHFVAMGDMGSGAPFQTHIANRLVSLHQQQPFPLMLLLGDILYPVGDVDKDGKRLITDMYAPLLAQNVRLLGALGNHDYIHHHGDHLIQFLNMPGHYYHQRVGPVDFFALDTNQFDDKQASWLKTELSIAQAPWRVVFAHHPLYSSGEHGNNTQLLKTLAPLLAHGQADLYLAGHDHEYERFTTESGFLPIVSGGGGAYLRGFDKIVSNSVVRVKAHHVLVIDANTHRLEVQAIGVDGAQLDCVALNRPVVDPKSTLPNRRPAITSHPCAVK